MSRLPVEIKNKIIRFFQSYCPFSFKCCKCDISECINAGGLKLYQMIDDDK